MSIFVFCVNLLVAAFILMFAAEIFFLLVGGLMFVYKALHSKKSIDCK